MSAKSTIKTAAQLLDRFFRDAEGRTNRQIDVYFALEDMDVPRDKAEPALDYLKSRGLLNLFGTDIGFLTDKGVQAVVEELDIGKMDKEVRDFIQKPVAPGAPAPTPEPESPPAKQAKPRSPRPDRAQLTHIDLEGGEFTLSLGMRCRIGRADDNEVRINDKRASKHHAEVIYSNGRYVLVDLESANGTLLNGDYALEPIPLKHDDEIVIGRTMLLYQAPKVVPAPEPEAPKAPEEEPGTVVSTGQPPAPTERPAPSRDDAPSIRVVRGTPAAPPTPDPAPAPGPDLFAEPPTRAPEQDLFSDAQSAEARAPSSPNEDLFSDEPPTQIPQEPGPPRDDLFGDAPAAPSTSAPPDDLFSEGGPTTNTPTSTQGGDDLFSDSPTSDPTPVEVAPLEIEPLAGAPELSQAPGPVPTDTLDVSDTVASNPAAPAAAPPEVDDLWANDKTPTSGAPDILDNPPVQHDPPPPVEAQPPADGGDGATLMMDRDALAEPEELPHWSEAGPGEGTKPPFADSSLDAETEALTGEAMPEAAPSLAMPVVEAEDSAATMDAAPAHPEFFALLTRLKAEVQRADVPEQEALLDAIAVLEDHPYVRLALGRL